ncbi:CPBP family intramembrane metalloprotease [Aestuariibacter halophilus]|uniref:CPBP family intramembrane metalloprotease n=1 Tax=Fluctibacter halophilus TaxID=226011 RepID=A0ABS8G6X2_9ALTE|nr:CPBP family intramembrane glutamic endopeptidase [Aestuariibacter halophilus]MCC2616158.1 CPBP family intramembrane metalloprotease [Aestuariibacter halophilus]
MTNVSSPRLQMAAEVGLVLCAFFGTRFALRLLDISYSGPIGTVVALGAIYLLYRYRTGLFSPIGLRTHPGAGPAALSIVLTVAVTILLATVILPYLKTLTGYVPSDAPGRFDYIKGNATALVLSVVGIAWFAAAFGEEVLFRGFLMTRLAVLLGDSFTARSVAVAGQALLFAMLHGSVLANQLFAGLIALAYGIIYFTLAKRSLWPLIVAHAIPDTISFIQMYAAQR